MSLAATRTRRGARKAVQRVPPSRRSAIWCRPTSWRPIPARRAAMAAVATPLRAPCLLCVPITPSWTSVESSSLRPNCSFLRNRGLVAAQSPPQGGRRGRRGTLRPGGPRGAITLHEDCRGVRKAEDGSKPGGLTGSSSRCCREERSLIINYGS